MSDSSRIPGFHQLTPQQRQTELLTRCGLAGDQHSMLVEQSSASLEIADAMSENVVGTFNLPFAVATNLRVDDVDVLIPMVTEESSVVAAVCNGARQCREGAGIQTAMVGENMIGQIQILDLVDPQTAITELYRRSDDIKAICDHCDPTLVSLGGGFRELEIRLLDTIEPMVVVHLIVDTRDAMGANAINTMAESLAPHIEQWTGGRVGLKILSNLADRRVIRASGRFCCDAIGGEPVRDAMLTAGEFAFADPYRAATHNKGIMNGVTAVTLATGNDTRAVEAGAHAYASRSGRYRALTRWSVDPAGELTGSIELPMPVGIVGGATRVHPMAKLALSIMNIQTARQLAGIIAAVGLVQNFSAMKALATEGIQRGHMSLHAKNLAVAAGAVGEEVDKVSRALISDATINSSAAESALKKLRQC